ncbi:MAG: hypothetical protein D6722_19945, partial [Bacteroidetes bacterium]
MKQLIRLSVSDFWLVFRDPALRVFWVLPFAALFVLIWLLPFAIEHFPLLGDYSVYVIMAAFTQTSSMFGFIYGMVLIDEKDTGVARVYGVLPVAKEAFVLGRLCVPFLIAVLFTWLMLLAQPFYALPAAESLLLSVVVGLMAPVYVLGLSILSKNKMMGLTWVKLFNL